jgi:glyoxylase-like metal-dependent hydrolase (beta-lactamase superfamily II)
MSSPTITPFNIGLLPADLTHWFGLPDGHRYAGRVENLPIQCYLISLPGRCLLVDAPSYEFPGDDSMLLPEFKGRTIAKLLAAAGTPPETITDVVITHPHLDHTLGLIHAGEPAAPVFPNARHYLSAKDWENLGNMEEVERRPLEVVHQAGLLTLVEGERDLGDGLTLLPAPGETPGHQILWLKDKEQETYFVADLFHHPLEFEEMGRHPIWADGPVMQASKSMLAQRAAESSAQVFFTHIEGAYCVEPGKPIAQWKKK